MGFYGALIIAAIILLVYFLVSGLIAVAIDSIVVGLAIYLFVTGHIVAGIIVLLILAFLVYIQGW